MDQEGGKRSSISVFSYQRSWGIFIFIYFLQKEMIGFKDSRIRACLPQAGVQGFITIRVFMPYFSSIVIFSLEPWNPSLLEPFVYNPR